MKQFINILTIALFSFASCTSESVESLQPNNKDKHLLMLTYTIPDAINATRAESSYIEAIGHESTVDGLHLLFFNPDEHGNGTFVASVSATLQGSNLKQNTISVTLPSTVKEEKEYNVLVVANLVKYTANLTDLTHYLNSFSEKTYGQTWQELQALLPIDENKIYSFPDGRLPMSGTTVKHAGNSAISVNLLRAAVRIDVKIADALTGITLNSVQLRNVASVIPFFRTQELINLPRALSRTFTVGNGMISNNKVIGGLYAVETSLNVSDSQVLQNDATCLLLNINSSSVHTGANVDKTWYRVNLNVNAETNMQFLKRNNAYQVVVNKVTAPGFTNPNDAYNNESMQIGAITILTNWKNSGVVPPNIPIY